MSTIALHLIGQHRSFNDFQAKDPDVDNIYIYIKYKESHPDSSLISVGYRGRHSFSPGWSAEPADSCERLSSPGGAPGPSEPELVVLSKCAGAEGKKKDLKTHKH